MVSTKQSDRVNLRVAPKLKARLVKAARISGQTLTDFVIQSAVAGADEALASRTSFPLSAKDWRKFNELLDAPPREIPELAKLLKGKSVFD